MIKSNKALLESAVDKLNKVSETPKLDAELLLAHVLQVNRSYLYTWPEKIPTSPQQAEFQALVNKRREGTPIAYLLGQQEFWSLTLRVNEHTLIPRPETELLIELALAKLAACKQHAKIADLGTGSGAIALAIAKERSSDVVYATDQSKEAISIAEYNAHQLALSNITFLQGEWCKALDSHDFDMIVSNPPYIAEKDPHLNQGDLRYEPTAALVSGEDGLADIRIIITQAREYLKPGGWLMLEHGYDQAEKIAKLMQSQGYEDISSHKDLTGHLRVTVAQMTENE